MFSLWVFTLACNTYSTIGREGMQYIVNNHTHRVYPGYYLPSITFNYWPTSAGQMWENKITFLNNLVLAENGIVSDPRLVFIYFA